MIMPTKKKPASTAKKASAKPKRNTPVKSTPVVKSAESYTIDGCNHETTRVK